MGKKAQTKLPTRLLRHRAFGWIMTVQILELDMVNIPHSGEAVKMGYLYDAGWEVVDED